MVAYHQRVWPQLPRVTRVYFYCVPNAFQCGLNADIYLYESENPMATPEPAPTTEIEVARYALRTFKEGVDSNGVAQMVSASWAGVHWAGGVCVAKCGDSKNHEAPHESCHCGVYGTLTLGSLMSQYGYLASKLITVIAAEGTTIIGDRGLRTAYARVVAYWIKPGEKAIEDICGGQFEGATRFTDLAEMLTAYEFPADDFQMDGSVSIKWTFADCVPDTEVASTRTFTIYNVQPGTYTEIVLGCGYKMDITPVTLSTPGCIVASLNWTPCTLDGCAGCPGCVVQTETA